MSTAEKHSEPDLVGLTSELVQKLASTPIRVAELIKIVPSNVLNLRDSSGEFSLLENVCHLRDIEIDGYARRLARILSEDQPLLTDIDGAQLAVERDYNRQRLAEALRSFTEARERNVALLESLSPDQLARTGTLEGVGIVNIGKLSVLMQEHDAVHLAELTRLSAGYQK